MTQALEAPRNGNERNLPAMAPPRLPYHPAIEERFGVDKASWKALVEAIFPSAQSTESVILALSYCRARKLDPFKRNVHIVPIWDSNRRCLVDTVWPGIGELRTTAFRTGEYAGRDAAEFGPILTQKVGSVEVTFPEWCRVTIYRLVKGQRVAFAGPQVYWLESYGTRKRDDDSPNEMWATRVRGQIEKCAEAAALRAAFPEEIGSDYIADEVRRDVRPVSNAVVGTTSSPSIEALNRRITSRPVSEGQTFEPAPEALEAAAAEGSDDAAEQVLRDAAARAREDLPTDNQAIEDGTEGDAGKSDAERVATWEGFMDLMIDAAMASNLPESELNRFVEARLKLAGAFGAKKDKPGVAWRLDMLAKVRNGEMA